MYIDLIVFCVLLALVFIFFKKFDCYVYFIAIFDMILRILTFIKYNIGLPDVAALIGKYSRKYSSHRREIPKRNLLYNCSLDLCYFYDNFLIVYNSNFLEKEKINS